MRKSKQTTDEEALLPHQGSLGRLDDCSYCIPVKLPDGAHELVFSRDAFDFSQRIFFILDEESKGVVTKEAIKSFVLLRCPVFWRRDEDLRAKHEPDDGEISTEDTFDEIWKSVVSSSSISSADTEKIGLEAWLVFCRFISLAQYLEAKRRFSARHKQQTMKHKNSPRGSEMVVVDVPPPEPPTPLSPQQLAEYERRSQTPLPPPQLDLDHSLLAAHDRQVRQGEAQSGVVKISLFGSHSAHGALPPQSTGMSSSVLEFAISFAPPMMEKDSDAVIVRRSMSDLQWLNDTFTSQKDLGGTLCGRILPPFPCSSASRLLPTSFPNEDWAIQKTTGAIASAKKGVGKLRDAAKSLVGSYMRSPTNNAEETPAPTSSPVATSPRRETRTSSLSSKITIPESYYNPNSPAGKARQVERFLNYLLEHPALSTSFPLNAVLNASQSGLEAAKVCVKECHRVTKDIQERTPQLDDSKSVYANLGNTAAEFGWVRTAAQAAVAMKVHGMLETTGMEFASARLQQASLPTFSSGRPSWQDDEAAPNAIARNATEDDQSLATREGFDFEEGVMAVQSELRSEEVGQNDGYDLLPLPVPAPERRILNAGNEITHSNELVGEARFRYGSGGLDGRPISVDDDDNHSAFLADINVDENIDKLREVIGSVENILKRCSGSSGAVGKAHVEIQDIHLELLKGLDSWQGMRGKFVSQRALLRGIAGVNQSGEVCEEGDLALVDDLSWQASLASSAVSAAEDVRSAVRISRTASNARATASSAAMSAQMACEEGTFANIDEARAAQTRTSIAKSHALRAAVVEHEAKSMKRHATLALANDVKTWNIHRKREMLQASIAFARSQHEASRRAVDGWSALRDGFIGPTIIPSFEKRSRPSELTSSARSRPLERVLSDSSEVHAVVFDDLYNPDQPIVAVDHELLNIDYGDSKSASADDPDPIFPFAPADPIGSHDSADLFARTESQRSDKLNDTKDDVMSASMQSLVDGLMVWGGGYDAEEEHFALPDGMAASILMEENGGLG